MFNSSTSIRVCVYLLTITIVLAGCNVPSETSTTLQPTITPIPIETVTTSNIASVIDAYMGTLADGELFIGSVLIAREGQVLVSDGYGYADRERNIMNTPKTMFRLASVGKQFTAVAILLLQEQGKLDLQASVCDYLSECPPEWEEISIQHLLTHSSGISDSTAANLPPTEMVNHFTGIPLDFPPGDDYSYSNSGYKVLGLVIEQVSGQPYGEFLQENIFTPLNLSSTGYAVPQDDVAVGYSSGYVEAPFLEPSILFAAGGISSTTEDLFRLWEAIHAEQLLSQDTLSEMFTGHAYIPFNE